MKCFYRYLKQVDAHSGKMSKKIMGKIRKCDQLSYKACGRQNNDVLPKISRESVTMLPYRQKVPIGCD